ncbi:ribonuclease HI [Thermogutta sp.]|jgi:ribonuclease HI|uniref:ribonuclease HI n=1 Tax=Thermogutta sp. TaxID=1962930 RepID=UPI003C7A1D7C
MSTSRSGKSPNPTDRRPEVLLFTDGACSGNPGPGGWAFILRHPASGKELINSGAESSTTNNRMELMAVIKGLEALRKPSRVRLISDSVYVGKGLTEWLPRWKAKGWKRSGNEAVKNEDLWRRLDELLSIHEVEFQHILGHTGHKENELCDRLAVQAYQELVQSQKGEPKANKTI